MSPPTISVAVPVPKSVSALSDGRSRPFRFLNLPGELRNRIYRLHLLCDQVIDLDPNNYRRIAPRLGLLLVSRHVHDEASKIFYGENPFRIFPRYSYCRRSLLTRLSPRYRSAIRSLELRLGPGWTDPPKTWVVDANLGL